MKKLKSILSKNPIFKGLNNRYLKIILEFASEVQFEPEELIFSEEESANNFYIILQGKVSLEALMAPEREPIIIQNLGENEVLGWSWLFPPHRWHFDARATEPTQAISIDGKLLREKCDEDHDLGFELMKRFANIIEQRLRSVRLQNPDMYAVHA
ncbi:MAG: Crp/Fnr family transcriptional regulator [Thermodesulfobacteriota bacterium]